MKKKGKKIDSKKSASTKAKSEDAAYSRKKLPTFEEEPRSIDEIDEEGESGELVEEEREYEVYDRDKD